MARILAEPHPDRATDPIEALLVRITADPLGRLVAAVWRAALRVVVDGQTVARTREALSALLDT